MQYQTVGSFLFKLSDVDLNIWYDEPLLGQLGNFAHSRIITLRRYLLVSYIVISKNVWNQGKTFRNHQSELTLTPEIIRSKLIEISSTTCLSSLESLTLVVSWWPPPRRGAGAEQAPGHGDLLVQGVAGQLPGGSRSRGEACLLTPAMVMIRWSTTASPPPTPTCWT